MKKLAFLVLSCSIVTGCATQSFNMGSESGEMKEEQMQAFFVSGIGQKQKINAAEICNGAEHVAKVESKQTFLDGFLGMASLGIYTPRDAYVYCK
tara:strand:+ start:821 stop:1105 length:285 start_codon:yes stop_codon:yes gene_type:complete